MIQDLILKWLKKISIKYNNQNKYQNRAEHKELEDYVELDYQGYTINYMMIRM